MTKPYGRTAQSRLRAMQDARDETPSAPGRDPGAGGPPPGYEDPLLWAMAAEFERQAYRNRVSLDGRGVPYVYRALERVTARTGLSRTVARNGSGDRVRGPDLGIALVRFFWKHAPWDADGDVVAQFRDPVMFEDCLRALRRAWSEQRSHAAILAQRQRPDYAPQALPRVRRPALRGSAWAR